ncbi:calpain-5-like [Amphiura filiformis]|uniref:calpain-5-like n=1 Tax=Amphiura filiformis TaxID=82378 RepID=UPI003B211947
MAPVVPYKGQKYEDLRKQHGPDNLFEDPEFPANDKSLFYKRASPGNIEWKRPGELCESPKFTVGGTDSGDVHQGSLGNCWFVAATANLAQESELWEKVVPNASDQDWDDDNKDNYAGIFHFRFWRWGQWQDVVVDDRLPTHNNKLIYVHSKENNEFWSALLEKAFAKFNGTYENLDGGNTADALVDFTGGVAQSIELQQEKYFEDEEKKKELHQELKKCADRHFLISASIKVTSAEEMEAKTETGLIKGHAYGVTAVKTVKLGASGLSGLFNKEKVYLVRLRNPWGAKEWNGPWSDDSEEWKKISDDQKKKIGVVKEDDGEFWMPFDSFVTLFTSLIICRMPNKSYLSISRTWNENLYKSAWKYDAEPKKNRAGGCVNFKDTYLQNPQFLLDVTGDEDDVMIALTQPDTRADQNQSNKTIGFHIMKAEANRKYRVSTPLPKLVDSQYINSRSVFVKRTFTKGKYVIVPTIFEQKAESELMIRIFTDGGSPTMEMMKDQPSQGCMSGIRGYPRAVTKIQVLSATGLKKQDISGGADPYVYIKCEGKTARSPVKDNTLNPEWDFQAIFYRKKPQNPIIVEIWNSNTIKDQFMGQATLMGQVDPQPKHHVLPLHGRGRDSEETMPGNVSLVITSSEDLTAF